MERVLSVLLVEDDASACQEFRNIIDTLSDMELCGVTNNSTEAVSYVLSTLPDAVILDLELNQGGGNGLLFLTELEKLTLNKRPYILVTTHNPSIVTHDFARQHGADFIMTKYQSDYCAQNVIEFLEMMGEIICSKTSAYQTNSSELSSVQTEEHYFKRIQRELHLIGINPRAKGFQYLTDAILITIDAPQRNISRLLAEKYKKSDASIERAMENAICRAWRVSDPDDLLTYYDAIISSERGVPTLTEFIYYYANKIKNNL